MSAWQFKTEILPADGLIALLGHVPKLIDQQQLDRSLCWAGFSEFDRLQTAIGNLLHERESWSELATMFGMNGKDEIEIWRTEAGHPSRICLSFCLNEPNASFIQSALSCASTFKCVFFGIQSQMMFSPSISEFVAIAETCSAARFVPIGKELSSLLP